MNKGQIIRLFLALAKFTVGGGSYLERPFMKNEIRMETKSIF